LLFKRVAAQRGIQFIPSMDKFITPIAEVVEDDDIKIKEQILAAYNNEEEAADGENSEEQLIAKVTLKQAIEAMKIRILYEEQHGDSESDKLWQLERDIRQLAIQKGAINTKQSSLMAYFR
jgi:hypothetical protein